MIKGFWLVPLGIITNVALFALTTNSAVEGHMPAAAELGIMILVAELPLLIFMILNLNHKKRTNPNSSLQEKEIELLRQSLRDKDDVIETLRGKS